jgi:hypothetical protein
MAKEGKMDRPYVDRKTARTHRGRVFYEQDKDNGTG